MTEEQIDKMLEMHRYLIKCEQNVLISRINGDSEKEVLQEEFNNTKWQEFAKWFKMIKDND